MSDTLGQPFPSIPAPFVRVLDNDGNLIGHGLIEQIWLQLLIALWQRTGGAQGVDSIEALLFAVSSTDASVAAAGQAELSPLLQQTIEREVQRFVLELSPRAADASLEALLFVDAGGMAAAASAAINVSYDDSGTGLGTNVQDAIDALFAIASGGGSGNVVGPAGAVANDLVLFNGATGLIIKDSNVAITTDGTLGGNSDALIATEKAVKTYVDASAGGGIGPGKGVYQARGTAAPLLASLGWINQGTATAVDGTNALLMTCPNAVTSIKILEMAAPGTPFSVYMRARAVAQAINFTGFGLNFRNSTNLRMLSLGLIYNGGQIQQDITRWTSPTAFSAVVVSRLGWTVPEWFRVDVTATTITGYFSFDGWNWDLLGSDTLATFLTATGGALDKIGIFGRPDGGFIHPVFYSFSTTPPV